jgi:uncharacterized BrkB/YihY/UPF0761 family membrane protein
MLDIIVIIGLICIGFALLKTDVGGLIILFTLKHAKIVQPTMKFPWWLRIASFIESILVFTVFIILIYHYFK